MGNEAQAGDSSKLLVVQWSCGMQQGAGGSSRAVSHSSRAAFARQCPPSSFRQPTGDSTSPCLSPCVRASSKQPLLLPDPGRRWCLGHCARVNIYVVRAFLPLPCIFLPFLKCHRSAVSIIVQEMSSLLAGSLTLTCAESTVAALLSSAAGPCIHPGSSEDMARGETGQSGMWPQSCLWLWLSFSQLQLGGTPIPWSTGQIRIPGDLTLCLCCFRANIQTRLTELPACTQQRAHSGNSGVFQACDFFFVLQTKPRSLEMLLKGLLSIGDFFSQEEICKTQICICCVL